MKTRKPASVAIAVLCLAALAWSSPAHAQAQTVPFKVHITELWQLDVNQDPIIGNIAELSPTILWPPNHKFVDVTATITFTDNCDSNPTVTLVSITSNEPESGFLGQGDNAPDIQGAAFGTDDRTFALRSERGTGQGHTGRVYTVTYRVTDKAGNATVKSAIVTVPTSNSGQ